MNAHLSDSMLRLCRWRSLLAVDDLVEGVVAALERTGMLEHTFIVSSKHGESTLLREKTILRLHDYVPLASWCPLALHSQFYTSDHGYHFGHFRLPPAKMHVYEFDVRVPFIW